MSTEEHRIHPVDHKNSIFSPSCEALVDLERPHWECHCGTVAMPLTDDTPCGCGDIYEQEWSYVDPVGVANEKEAR